jgi:hypothetical protein
LREIQPGNATGGILCLILILILVLVRALVLILNLILISPIILGFGIACDSQHECEAR